MWTTSTNPIKPFIWPKENSLNMKNPLQDLSEEHGSIMLMLTIMGKVAQRLRNEEEVRQEHLLKISEFLRNFADKCHHEKEEDILFPELVKNPANTRTINELVGEHKTGRDYIRGMADSTETYEPGNSDAFHIAVNAEGYIQLLTEHIKKENTNLFPIADKELSEECQEEVMKRFEKLEREVIGVEKHEEYRRWLGELREIYF